MPKLILEMSDDELESATTDVLAAGLMFRITATESHLWAELDAVNDRIPGFGYGAKAIIAEALERLAGTFRTSSLPRWKKVAD